MNFKYNFFIPFLFSGITGKPWTAQGAKLKKHFERNILIPRTDYGSVFLYWREILMGYHSVDRNFNVTAIAKRTINYPLPVLKEVLTNIMTPRRIIQLRYNPLTPQEIYEVGITPFLKQLMTDSIFHNCSDAQRICLNSLASKFIETNCTSRTIPHDVECIVLTIKSRWPISNDSPYLILVYKTTISN